MKVSKNFKARRRQYRRGQDDETKVRSSVIDRVIIEHTASTFSRG